MKITIHETVKAQFPDLHIFFKVVQKESLDRDFKVIAYDNTNLTDLEFRDYQLFRKRVSGTSLLAVERLLHRGESNLPRPDPITSLIIQTSYITRLPITVFCDDSFSSIIIRFSKIGDVLKLEDHDEEIKPGLLVADTSLGILGILGTKSSSLGKLSDASKSLVLLSFGCSPKTSKKSMKLINQIAGQN